MNKWMGIIILSIVFYSCAKNENNYNLKVVDDLNYEVIHSTTETELEKWTRSNSYSDIEVDSLKSLIDENEYFILKVNHNQVKGDVLQLTAENEIDFEEKTSYLNTWIQNDFIIVQNTDTSFCKLSHYEKGYHLQDGMYISLVFDAINRDQPFTFIYNDNLLGSGSLKYVFNQ